MTTTDKLLLILLAMRSLHALVYDLRRLLKWLDLHGEDPTEQDRS